MSNDGSEYHRHILVVLKQKSHCPVRGGIHSIGTIPVGLCQLRPGGVEASIGLEQVSSNPFASPMLFRRMVVSVQPGPFDLVLSSIDGENGVEGK